MQGNKTNLIEILRKKRESSPRPQESLLKIRMKQSNHQKEELKKYLAQHPKTNLISFFQKKKKMEEDETPESQKILRHTIEVQGGNLSPISANHQRQQQQSISDESTKALKIAIPKRQSLISPKLQQMSSLYSQNSILESPCESETSFLVGPSNGSELELEQENYSLRIEQLQNSARIMRSQSQVQNNISKFIKQDSLANKNDGINTLNVPSKSAAPRRLQSFSVYDRQSTPTKPPTSADQRRSVRLMRGMSGMNQQTIETNILERSRDEAGRKKLNNYVMLHELGRGGFGKVRLVYQESQQKYYAMKIANKNRLKRKLLTKDTSAYTLLEQEIAILKKVDHQNVVKLYEVIDDPEESKLYLIMDYVKKGAIGSKQYWKSEGYNIDWDDGAKPPLIPILKIRSYLRDFLLGLDYLHNFARIIHRDIKPENLLVDENDKLKIADFGVAQMMENSSNDLIQGEIGTKAFFPPEAFKNNQVKGKPADVWATGVTFYMITQGKPPFPAKTIATLKDMVNNHQQVYNADTDPLLQDFLNQCLKKDSRQRATLEQLMDHPFVTAEQPLLEQEFDQNFFISENELSKALTRVTLRATVRVFAKLKQHLQRSRERIKSRTTTIK